MAHEPPDPHSPSSSASPPNGVVVAVRGGLSLERRLLATLADAAAAAREDPGLLQQPVLVIVPSVALLRHLQSAIARELGPAVLGIKVQLVGHVADDVLRAAGVAAPQGAPMFEVLARRAAAEQGPLREALDRLDDGFGVATRSIRDLLSAGLTAELGSAASRVVDGRPRALVQAALETRRSMIQARFGRRSDALALAADVLEGPSAGRALSAGAVHVYGFADAPGSTTRFLAAVLRRPHAHLWIDRPVDPCDPSVDDAGARFLDRFLGRLGLDADSPPAPGDAAPLTAFSKAGEDREAREVAHRVRLLLDDGATPESIAIVARRLDPYAAALRKHLRALAIPFSGGAVPARWSPAQRRVDAVLALMTRRQGALVEEWLEARRGRAREADLRLAFRVLGSPLLGAAAEVDLDRWLHGDGGLPLPVRRGLSKMNAAEASESAATDDDDGDTPGGTDATAGRQQQIISARRKVRRETLATAIEEARATLEVLLAWPDRAPMQVHVARARALGKTLRFAPCGHERLSPPDRALASRWSEALDQLHELAPRFEVTDAEFRLLLRQLLDRPWESLGGAGGGVQVLDVPHARGLTFEHLFLMGLERDVFPRAITEDPMLPDRDRRALGRLLPDLATAGGSHDEERYLFATALASAPRVTLSWRHADADGRELAPSAFVERLVRGGLLDMDSIRAARPDAHARTATESLHALAVAGQRSSLPSLLTQAIAESRARLDVGAALRKALPAPEPAALAAARLAILDAVDPDRSTREGRRRLHGPTPWFGILGKPRKNAHDPRLNVLAVTGLEGIARCPWRDFLGRDLRLERHPDPLAGPPEFTKLLIGNIVHETLEALLHDAGVPAEVALDAITTEPVLVRRPSEEAISQALTASVERLARAEGHFLPGLHATLVTLCRPYVDNAFDIDFDEGPVTVVGVEASAAITLEVDGRPIDVKFKADRVDRAPDGTLLLTDYKTGKSISEAKRKASRDQHLAKKIAGGTHLQAGAYAASRAGAAGRYLFLQDGLHADHREFTVRDGDANMDVFRTTAAALLAARTDGVQFPRLGDGTGKNGPSCNWCEHLEACVQNDSGLKLRIEDLADRVRESPPSASDGAFDRHLRRLWKVAEGES